MPATSDSAGGPAQGARPLGTPKGWSRNEKAKTCRSAARFLTLFRPSPIDPLRGQILVGVGADSISARNARAFDGASGTPPPTPPLPLVMWEGEGDPSGAKINSMGVELKAPLCKGGSAGRRWGIVTLPIHRSTLARPQSLRPCGAPPFTQGRLYAGCRGGFYIRP